MTDLQYKKGAIFLNVIFLNYYTCVQLHKDEHKYCA